MLKGKIDYLKKTTNEDGVVAALAIDQRGSLKKMLAADGRDDANAIVEFKELASEELTKYTSAILLDPEYGIPGMKVRDSSCGLLTSYEKTGYDATEKGRLPDLLPTYSVKRLLTSTTSNMPSLSGLGQNVSLKKFLFSVNLLPMMTLFLMQKAMNLLKLNPIKSLKLSKNFRNHVTGLMS